MLTCSWDNVSSIYSNIIVIVVDIEMLSKEEIAKNLFATGRALVQLIEIYYKSSKKSLLLQL